MFKELLEAVQLKPGDIYPDETAYRAETGYKHEEGKTAQDVVDFEADEHGNEDIRTQANSLGLALNTVPARRAVWVTRSRKDAQRYGTPVAGMVLPNSIILATDNEGGYLVLMGGV